MSREFLTHPFEAFCPPDCRILILGSFPSDASRKDGFYYAHPRNRFWKVISALCGSQMPESLEEKKALLTEGGIALWDTIASCLITSSADSSIINAEVNDIPSLLRDYPIEAVFCNGKKSAELYKKHIGGKTNLPMDALPSTSPANASYSLEDLIEKWSVIKQYLR
ncbi:MAG: DNA-deoxyinosine glycosylase [Eubacteriaceae bacterium]|nr:DNA-deoxyinosine glycosylase [Eubacteriaceae bacterium]